MTDARKTHILVAAIDFGTTYSGYAYSSLNDFKTKPTKSSSKIWTASEGLISQKAPTSVVLDPQGKFKEFGYEAENVYKELADDGEHKDHYYFSRFKMMLYNKDGNVILSRQTKLKDIRKKEFPAIIVFTEAIKYLKRLMLEDMKRKGSNFKEKDILWVLTVPAIWNDSAKQFMREAAEKAGISPERLLIALEPEAASLYCKYINVQKKNDGEQNDLEAFTPGSQYLVLDAGGGTVDITVHRVEKNGRLKELERASGGEWGGTRVDSAFLDMLKLITTEEFLEEYSETHTEDYIDLLRSFEFKKRTEVRRGKINMKIPLSLSEAFFDKYDMDISEKCSQTSYKENITWYGDKIIMNLELFRDFFRPVCNGIVEHVKDLLIRPNVNGTKTILMVGGFSDSPILQQTIKEAFPECRVIIPPDAGLAVLKGAVIFGHDPGAIGERVAKYTYGIGITSSFDPKCHSADRKIMVGGEPYCSGVFDKYVTKGENVKVDERRETTTYVPLYEGQRSLTLPIYITENEHPQYIDECTKLGSISIDLSGILSEDEKKVKAALVFGGTELKVEGKSLHTGNVTPGTFNFLSDEL